MKITVQDILNKLTETEVIERLKEYRNAILVSEVDI